MFLMYVDESGDPGKVNSPTDYFILTGLILHESNWNKIMADLTDFRRMLKNTKGLRTDEEIHTINFINRPGELKRIKRNDRLDILKKCLDWLAKRPDISILTVAVNKTKVENDVFCLAWESLMLGFEAVLDAGKLSFQKSDDESGIILPDNTDGLKLNEIVRQLRRNKAERSLKFVIEEPLMKDSRYSFIHQMVDVVAYFAHQKFEQNRFVKKFSGQNYYARLKPVIVFPWQNVDEVGILEI